MQTLTCQDMLKLKPSIRIGKKVDLRSFEHETAELLILSWTTITRVYRECSEVSSRSLGKNTMLMPGVRGGRRRTSLKTQHIKPSELHLVADGFQQQKTTVSKEQETEATPNWTVDDWRNVSWSEVWIYLWMHP